MTMSSQTQNADADFEARKNGARVFGGGVYIGGVLAATVLFITFVLTAFPEKAYFTRVVMTLAGLAVGCSMLAFPFALHNWAIAKKHRLTTIILYYIEMVFIAVNTIVSFVNLLAKYTGFTAPEWSVLYEPFSVLSVIYVIFAWGTIFLSDPHAQREAKYREFDERYEDKIAEKRMEFLDTPEGEQAILVAATDDIQARISQRKAGKHFGTGQMVVDPKQGFVQKQSTTEQPDMGDRFRAPS